MTDLEIKINDFLDDVLIYKTIDTYKYYKSHLSTSGKFFSSLSDITLKRIKQYVIYLKENGCCNKTINKKISCLKYMCSSLKIKNSELLEFPKLREDKKIPHYLSVEELKKLHNYLMSDNVSLLDSCIVLLFMYTGLRLNELINIKRSNIDFCNNIILLESTKTHLQRFVPFDNNIVPYLKKYLFIHNSEYPFRLSKRSIQTIFYRINKKMNFRHFSPHVLRHSFATLLVSNNISLEKLRILMGHTNLSTTQIYLHLNFENIQNDYINKFKL